MIFNILYKLKLLPNVICVGKVGVIQSLKLEGKGKITLDAGCVLGVYPSPSLYHGEFYLEARSSTAEITIGKRVYINNNAIIISDKTAIAIGDDTLICPNFICFDSNFHSLHPAKRLSSDYRCKPVNIGRNVFIGANVTILQGVTIGDNSVIGAGCVINSDIPSNVIVTRTNDLKITEIKRN
ncbi:DapH/DapD/GlmU-related protein [Shewanella xiamenensis]|uniref:DapH/DapD/GlmU-related protein n=1 Tax=Shewanella xiamenensis TaxID=332186 RepID=UPI00313D41EE